MRKTKKQLATLGLAVILASSMSMTSFAGQWQQDTTGWWYQNDDGTYFNGGWQWIEGKCYYFTPEGYCLINTTTPDGYMVDGSGAWIVNGIVQTQQVDPHINPINVETSNVTGNEVTDGKTVAQITLNQELVSLMSVADGVNNFSDKTLIMQTDAETDYMTTYNNAQLKLFVANRNNAVIAYRGNSNAILKNIPNSGIELEAFYINTGFEDADNGRKIVASTGRSDQIFELATGTYRMTRFNVENKHVEIVLTQGTDGNWYIYPNSATYIQRRY